MFDTCFIYCIYSYSKHWGALRMQLFWVYFSSVLFYSSSMPAITYCCVGFFSSSFLWILNVLVMRVSSQDTVLPPADKKHACDWSL